MRSLASGQMSLMILWYDENMKHFESSRIENPIRYGLFSFNRVNWEKPKTKLSSKTSKPSNRGLLPYFKAAAWLTKKVVWMYFRLFWIVFPWNGKKYYFKLISPLNILTKRALFILFHRLDWNLLRAFWRSSMVFSMYFLKILFWRNRVTLWMALIL